MKKGFTLGCLDGGSKARCYCILRDRWKNLREPFGLSKHLEKHYL